MNTPGKPKPSWRQSHYLLVALVVALVVVFITLFKPW